MIKHNQCPDCGGILIDGETNCLLCAAIKYDKEHGSYTRGTLLWRQMPEVGGAGGELEDMQDALRKRIRTGGTILWGWPGIGLHGEDEE